jgi:hypothetical protein
MCHSTGTLQPGCGDRSRNETRHTGPKMRCDGSAVGIIYEGASIYYALFCVTPHIAARLLRAPVSWPITLRYQGPSQ